MSDPVTEDYDDEEEVDRQMTLQIIKKVFADVVSANANSAWEMGDFQCQIGKNSCSFYTTKKKISDMCNAKIRVHTGYGGAKLCDYLGVLEYYKSYPSFTIRLYPCQNKKFLLQIFFKNNIDINLEDDIDPIVEQMCRQWKLKPSDGWRYIKDESPL